MDLNEFRNSYIELQFLLREKFLSKLRFRAGLPRVPSFHQLKDQNDFYHHIVTSAFDRKFLHSVNHVIDVGCSHWSYAQALAVNFPNASLTGIEVDGGRRYLNLYRRIDTARAFARNLAHEGRKIEVMESDFRNAHFNFSPSDHVVFCFFLPFVSDNPCHRWGLPQRFADFASLLTHSQKLTPSCRANWISLHQGEWEGEIAQQIYDLLNIPVKLTRISPKDCPPSWCRPYESWIFNTSH